MRRFSKLLAFAAILSVGAPAAHAFCIIPSDPAIPNNDFIFNGCGLNGAGVTVCDMNGTQDRLPTHGVVAIDGSVRTFSWTRNLISETEEYTCQINTATGFSQGAVHYFSGIGGAPKDYLSFTCRLVPACP